SADCAAGETCAAMNGALACRLTSEIEPIRIGMIGPMEGPSEDLGKEMSRGIEAALTRFNAEGGAFGRKVELAKRNDNYNPETAVEMMYDLLDVEEVVDDEDTPDVRGDDGVFALVGNVGTPTMLATAPVATKNRVVFFAPFTGAQTYLRDSTKSPYVYNYRAGYFDETAAMVEYLHRGRIPAVIPDPPREDDYRRILVFAQNDTFGDAGYNGVIAAYNANVAPLAQTNAIARIGYNREQLDSVGPAVLQAQTFLEGVLAQAPENSTSKEQVAIIMVDTYQPAALFIRGVKDWINADANRAARLEVLFMNVSFVGSDSLAEELLRTNGTYADVITTEPRSYAENVMVTQVVPDYESQAPCVVDYREDIRLDNSNPSFTSLEGYIVTRLFTEALKLNGPLLSSDEFVRTLDSKVVNLDIGIGTLLNFSATQHQASTTVWGTEIGSDGRFSVSFVWENGVITPE
ncbi:MAG TPA: ABC transporter substrate-binding protein, partial [Polyangiaceae bacterium]|nr:ABC transporter substrate-binding protein [Polyangiaceae bacterium]